MKEKEKEIVFKKYHFANVHKVIFVGRIGVRANKQDCFIESKCISIVLLMN